jgi:hypothetical protein
MNASSSWTLRIAAATVSLSTVLIGGPALASVAQPTPVSTNPADTTPHLVADADVAQPRVDAFVPAGGTMYAGGLFSAVTGPDQVATVPRTNLMAFDRATGAVDEGFAPQVNGTVDALEISGGALFVGGGFSTVDGQSRRALVKIDLDTGQVDSTFNAGFASGNVTDLQMVGSRLFVAGSAGTKLMALDPDTGANTGFLNLNIRGKLDGTTSGPWVSRIAVNPQQSKLVAVGNFQTVAGQIRHRAFMADLGASSASLDGWYYNSLTKPCGSTTPSRQAYLTDVDFSPDGSYFVLAGAGYTPRLESEIGETICDAAARFDVSVPNPDRPVWINYTGGDTIRSIAATGAAVYVQGHFRWLDNPYGANSAGPGAVTRKAVGAIDPVTGNALKWNPGASRAEGGKMIYPTQDGVWWGADGTHFRAEYHRGIAFTPLP